VRSTSSSALKPKISLIRERREYENPTIKQPRASINPNVMLAIFSVVFLFYFPAKNEVHQLHPIANAKGGYSALK
jgi:hypothetical protein